MRQAFLLFTLAFLLFNSCKKDKLDVTYDNRQITDARKPSAARIINLSGFNQVIVNGDSLTGFIVRDPESPDFYKYPGTPYFPEDGQLGKVWNMPLDLFEAGEKADVKITALNYQGLFDDDITFTAANDGDNPTDYYLLPSPEHQMDGQPEMVSVSRGVSAPSRPDHFKVRIINLTGTIKNPGFNASGMQESLEGLVSLVYADGMPVSDETSHISMEERVSEYVELPYGTYQFRVLTADGRQFPAAVSGSDPYDYRYIDPPTSTMAINLMETTNQIFAPVQAFMPGGIYTIVVTAQPFNYFINEMDESVGTLQNAFMVINDNSIPANLTYCRIQGVNALQPQAVTFRANGKPLPGTPAFGQPGDYGALVHGNYTLEAIDASGQVLAEAEHMLRPGQNYTVWLYPSAEGDPRLLVVANDLSGSWYKGQSLGYTGTAEDDATFNRFEFRFPFLKRYLNLSPGNPFVTFTLNNGQAESGGTEGAPDVNLQPGQPIAQYPYIRGSREGQSYEVMAYRSAPDKIPGTWAEDVPILTGSDFIARKALYENIGRPMPVHEPGIYTVALIGPSTTGTETKMIIVKHNK